MPDDAPRPGRTIGPPLPSTVPVRTHRVRRWLFVVLAVVALAGSVAWWLRPVAVTVGHPRTGPAIEAVYATGTVEPSIMLPVAAHITARLAALYVDEGQSVREGQELARLEDADLAASLAQARSQEAFARADYERYAHLVLRGAVARSQYDRAHADWVSAQAVAQRAAAQARFARLVAPAGGTIIRRDGEIGQLMTPGDVVFWVAVASPPRVTADVDEEDVAQVRPGQRVVIHADAFAGRVFEGRVTSVTPKGDPTARSYRVRVAIAGATPLQVGMTAEINVVIRRRDNALLVPDSAVDGEAVWLVDADRLHRRHVETGIRGERDIEIISGLTPTDRIVVHPTPALRDGTRVRSVPESP